MTSSDAIAALLPLQPAAFHILVALADGELHGYAILQKIEERTAGDVRLSAGTLYRNLERMLEDGLIAELTRRPAAAASDDPRRRYYKSTTLGTAVVRAELARLNDLVRLARSAGLTPAAAPL